MKPSPETVAMWRNALDCIISEKEIRKMVRKLKPEYLKYLLYFYHHKAKGNKELFNKILPLLLRKIELIERRRKVLERLARICEQR